MDTFYRYTRFVKKCKTLSQPDVTAAFSWLEKRFIKTLNCRRNFPGVRMMEVKNGKEPTLIILVHHGTWIIGSDYSCLYQN